MTRDPSWRNRRDNLVYVRCLCGFNTWRKYIPGDERDGKIHDGFGFCTKCKLPMKRAQFEKRMINR